jgi:hypothetical protein
MFVVRTDKKNQQSISSNKIESSTSNLWTKPPTIQGVRRTVTEDGAYVEDALPPASGL